MNLEWAHTIAARDWWKHVHEITLGILAMNETEHREGRWSARHLAKMQKPLRRMLRISSKKI